MTEVAKFERAETLPADPMISMIERLAMDPNADLDKLERMLAMKERMEQDAAKKAFAVAFAQMQADLPVIAERGKIKNKAGEVQSTYPLWEDVNAALRGPLSAHGLSMSFDRRKDDGKTIIGCIVTHEMGHSRRAEIDLPRDTSGSKNEVQGEGSTVSYGQRYSSKMLINWISEGTEDDDGQKAGRKTPITEKQFQDLRKLIENSGANEDSFLSVLKIDALHELPQSRFYEAEALLRRKMTAKGAA